MLKKFLFQSGVFATTSMHGLAFDNVGMIWGVVGGMGEGGLVEAPSKRGIEKTPFKGGGSLNSSPLPLLPAYLCSPFLNVYIYKFTN